MAARYSSSEAKRAHSSHAGRHISPAANPLPKGQACATCKARKVKCDAAAPACSACRRTAKFEGRDPDLVVCQYGAKACSGVKRKRTSKPKRRLPSYASDDDYNPSSDESLYQAGSSSTRSRKVRASSDASASSSHSSSSTPSLVAESSNSWSSSTSTLINGSKSEQQHSNLLPTSTPAPLFASMISASPISTETAFWPIPAQVTSLPPLSINLDASVQQQQQQQQQRQQSLSPPSSAPLTPPSLDFSLPEYTSSLFSNVPLPQANAGLKSNPLLPLATPGFDTLLADSFGFDNNPFAEDLLLAMASVSKAPEHLAQQQQQQQQQYQSQAARSTTPFLMTTPGVFGGDGFFDWQPFDYFAPQSFIPRQ